MDYQYKIYNYKFRILKKKWNCTSQLHCVYTSFQCSCTSIRNMLGQCQWLVKAGKSVYVKIVWFGCCRYSIALGKRLNLGALSACNCYNTKVHFCNWNEVFMEMMNVQTILQLHVHHDTTCTVATFLIRSLDFFTDLSMLWSCTPNPNCTPLHSTLFRPQYGP